MSLDEGPLVGSDSARALRSPTREMDVIALGPGDAGEVAAAVAPFGARVIGRTAQAESSPASWPLSWPSSSSPSAAPAVEPTVEPTVSHAVEQWPDLVLAADAAELRDDRPLVLVAADLRLSPVALLDVLDGPAQSTATLVLDPAQVLDGSSLATVRTARTRLVTAAGAGVEVAPHATGYALGLIRLAGCDRAAAARLWRDAGGAPQRSDAAATRESAADMVDRPTDTTADAAEGVTAPHPVDLALRALVMGGLGVAAQPLGLYGVSRGATRVTAAAGGPWQQRLRTSSRGNDSPFSKAVIRPLSRRLTAVGLRHDWTPNAVTAASLTIGLGAAAMVLVDTWWAWALAAVLLQLSLVVDCVDGEIARFTRTYSPLGAWLDGVSDRVKEFAVVGTVTAVGLRAGHDLWGLAIALVAVLTIRQVEDQGYNTRLRLAAAAAADAAAAAADAHEPPSGSISEDAATYLRPSSPSLRTRTVTTVKQVLHVPIAERYLVMSLGLLTHDPVLLLGALSVAVGVALLWTHVGRIVRAVTHRDLFTPDRPDPDLVALLDLGPIARGLMAMVNGPVALAWAAVVLGGAASVLVVTGAPPFAAVGAVALAAAVLGPGSAGAGSTRLGWQLPGAMVAAEASVVAAVAAQLPPGQGVLAYLWFGAVAWHLYDMTYRLRETGERPAPWVQRLTLGVEGRILLVVLWWALGWNVATVFAIGTPVLLLGWFGESRYSWRSMVRPLSGSH
ncbi:MAG: DUF5941 domain-containing protein [Terracoccus sp.]